MTIQLSQVSPQSQTMSLGLGDLLGVLPSDTLAFSSLPVSVPFSPYRFVQKAE